MNGEALGHEIIRQASRFIGLREVRPNADWDNPGTPQREAALAAELRSLMRPSPWEEGWAYCAAFCEGIVTEGLRALGISPASFAKLMTPHCVTSAENFKARGLLCDVPETGAVWLARHGRTRNGHAGVLTARRGTTMATIEANTSLDASSPHKDREGDWITTRLSFLKGRGSLVTLGFINPSSILKLIAS